MLNILYLLVNNKTSMMFLGCTYKLKNGMMILYLTYWTYAHMYVLFH